MGIKHHKQATKEESESLPVEIDYPEWNEEHDAGACADVLTDHTKTLHDGLGINADQVDGVDLPATIIEVLSDHDKATHDTLSIDAATLEGSDKATVQDHAPKTHANEVHSKTFIEGSEVPANETDPNVDATLQGVTLTEVQDHTPKAHTLASHSTKAHSELTGVGADDHHRKWAWADEQGWIRSIKVPLADDNAWAKHASNPIFSPAASGWDSKGVLTPCVIYKDGQYWLFYCGYSNTGGWGVDGQIGVAYATSPEGPYTRSASNPIVPRIAGTWADALATPQVVYDDVAGLWKMWVMGEDAAGTCTIGYCTASDPEGSWSAPTQVNTTIHHQVVYKMGNIYVCYYEDASGDVGLATSPDGITWTLYAGNPVIARTAGAWDSGRLTHVGLFWNLGVYYVLYSACSGAGCWQFDIGMALSSNGWTFSKWIRNPVLRRTAATWDADQIGSPSLLMVNNVFYLWYQGLSAAGGYHPRIGIACIPAW